MKSFIIILAAALLLGGCSPCKHIASTQQRDSTHIEVRTEVIYVPDTVFVEIPAQTAERTTVDSVSHLENEYATSDAKINNDGTLYHDLRTKPQQKPVPIEKPVEHKDSIIYRDKVIEKVVPVEKELTKWQKTQMRGFWIVSVILFVVVFRKPLLNLIRRFI